jgi:DNA-binding NarL/FixJ family response regulator
MIAADKRKAIFLLHESGMAGRDIARRLEVSRSTVGIVIGQRGELPQGEVG